LKSPAFATATEQIVKPASVSPTAARRAVATHITRDIRLSLMIDDRDLVPGSS
jgi:hypothetical protein